MVQDTTTRPSTKDLVRRRYSRGPRRVKLPIEFALQGRFSWPRACRATALLLQKARMLASVAGDWTRAVGVCRRRTSGWPRNSAPCSTRPPMRSSSSATTPKRMGLAASSTRSLRADRRPNEQRIAASQRYLPAPRQIWVNFLRSTRDLATVNVTPFSDLSLGRSAR